MMQKGRKNNVVNENKSVDQLSKMPLETNDTNLKRIRLPLETRDSDDTSERDPKRPKLRFSSDPDVSSAYEAQHGPLAGLCFDIGAESRRIDLAKEEKKRTEDAARLSNDTVVLLESNPNPVEKELADARQNHEQNQLAVIQQGAVVKKHQSRLTTLTTKRDLMLGHAVSEGKQSVDARSKMLKQEAEEAERKAKEAKEAERKAKEAKEANEAKIKKEKDDELARSQKLWKMGKWGAVTFLGLASLLGLASEGTGYTNVLRKFTAGHEGVHPPRVSTTPPAASPHVTTSHPPPDTRYQIPDTRYDGVHKKLDLVVLVQDRNIDQEILAGIAELVKSGLTTPKAKFSDLTGLNAQVEGGKTSYVYMKVTKQNDSYTINITFKGDQRDINGEQMVVVQIPSNYWAEHPGKEALQTWLDTQI